ncbi:MAG: hypothetical protein DCC67_00395 [Planctomycetota bacterium]|nr:MAG: hypothetical protein DCC67_00395 [Planctomycetota bacterium]
MTDLAQIIEGLADALSRVQIPHAFGGALAASYWGIVRTTQDVDCLVALPALSYQRLADELQALGCQQHDESGQWQPVDALRMRQQATQRHLIECYLDAVRIELFVPVVPLQDEILRRAVLMPFGQRQIWVTTAEDMILIKLAFHRAKDLQDVRGMFWVQRGQLDLDYLRRWSTMTHADSTQRELEDLIEEYGGG